MPQISRKVVSKGSLGLVAVSLMAGAVQIASGRDLDGMSQALPIAQMSSPAAGINRATKGDRAAGVSASAGQSRTISLRLESLSDSSVLVRLPVGPAARDTSSVKPGNWKVACEPVASLLTEVAKQLEPGRCVT